MSSLTKEELRKALISHGVELPPISAKKEELVLLYQEHVTPADDKAGDFSSDDEEVAFNDNKPPKEYFSSRVESAVDISAMDDDTLFRSLKQHGVEVGPIVASTRPLYEKKLAVVMFGPVEATESSKEFSDTEPEDEDDEEDDQPAAVVEKVVPATRSEPTSPPSPSKSPGLRQRMTGFRDELDNSLGTGSPRKSIHSYKVTEVKRQTVTRNRDGQETRDSHHTVEREESDRDSAFTPTKKSSLLSSVCPPFLYLLLILLVLLGIYLVFSTKTDDGGVTPAEKVIDAINSAVEHPPLPPPVERDPAPDASNVADV